MNALQSLNTSGVHAKRCSGVPCAKQRAGVVIANSMATNARHGAKGIDRNGTALFWLSMFIGGLAMHNRSRLGFIIADIDIPLPKPVLVAKRQRL
jgi:hypothetical protein